MDQVAKRAPGYDMPGFTVDGNDPFAMYAAANAAINRARDGEGPTLIEAMTFRFHGHVFGDDDAYMTKQEKAEALAKDPVPAFRTRLIADGTASEAQIAAIEAEIAAQIQDAIEFALSSDMPALEELLRDVYADTGVA